MHQVKVEMISIMNFISILQGELSFMFARGVTCNTCYVERKGGKVFSIDVVIALIFFSEGTVTNPSI